MIKKLIVLICIAFNGLAQIPAKLSKYEKHWALLHPIAAIKANHLGKCVAAIYKETLAEGLDSYPSGGRLDAYRHVFFMAAFAQKISIGKLRKLGRAHEKANYRQFLKSLNEEGEVPDSLSSVMDLQNNELGFKLGKENKHLTLLALKELCVDQIKKGAAMILKRNKGGNYVDCGNRVIVISTLNRPWNIPKCLVASNYVYKD